MDQFNIRLNAVEDSYYGFVAAVMTYVQKKPSRYDAVSNYMTEHPYALSSDILRFISTQDDFYEDAAYDCKDAG